MTSDKVGGDLMTCPDTTLTDLNLTSCRDGRNRDVRIKTYIPKLSEEVRGNPSNGTLPISVGDTRDRPYPDFFCLDDLIEDDIASVEAAAQLDYANIEVGKLFTLRDDQALALNMLKQAIAEGARRPLVQAPTGFGKTVLAAHIVDGALRKGKRLVFLVPALSLIDQTFQRFCANGIKPTDMGIIQSDHPWSNRRAPIQIATAQTMARRDFPETDIVCVDEAHVRQKVIERWMEACPEVLFIGLSATPWAKGLGNRFDHLVKPTNIAKLIEDGHLSKFRVFAPARPDLSGVRTTTRSGVTDYREGDLEEVMSGKALVGGVVETWQEKADGLPTLVFAVSRKHAGLLYEAFVEADIPAEYCDAYTSREDRHAMGERLAAGTTKVIVNIGTLTTGVDWDIRCIVLARPTKSEMLFVQIIGRGLRTAEGKDHCLILDHSNTHLNLGLVTEIDYDELCTGKDKDAAEKKKKKEGEVLRVCPSCTAIMDPRQSTCVECGWENPVKVQHVNGTLREITGDATEETTEAVARLRKLGAKSIFSQLTTMANDRGYSSGWVAHKYRAIFNRWPNRQRFDPDCATVTFELRNWITSEQIKFKNSRNR